MLVTYQFDMMVFSTLNFRDESWGFFMQDLREFVNLYGFL